MELNKETLERIEREYYEWCDDCDDHGLLVFCNPEEVFRFIEHFIDKEVNND